MIALHLIKKNPIIYLKMFYMFLKNKNRLYCVQWEKKVVVFYPDI